MDQMQNEIEERAASLLHMKWQFGERSADTVVAQALVLANGRLLCTDGQMRADILFGEHTM